MSALKGYFIAPDWKDEPTLWRGSPDDPYPVAVLHRCQVAADPAVWDLIARAAQ